MQPYRVIVHTNGHSDGQSTKPDDSNSLTRQFANTNDAPRDLLPGPVIWNSDLHVPAYIYAYRYVYITAGNHDHFEHQTLFWCANRPPIFTSYPSLRSPASASSVSHSSTVPTWFYPNFFTGLDSYFCESILTNVFHWTRLRFSWLDSAQVFLLDLNIFSQFDSTCGFQRDSNQVF